MEQEDLIKSLVGEGTGWDQVDTLSFIIYKPSKFPEAEFANIDLDKCLVELGKEDSTIFKTFRINAELNEIPNIVRE